MKDEDFEELKSGLEEVKEFTEGKKELKKVTRQRDDQTVAYLLGLEEGKDKAKADLAEAVELLKRVRGYFFLNWADEGDLKETLEAFLAKHQKDTGQIDTMLEQTGMGSMRDESDSQR